MPLCVLQWGSHHYIEVTQNIKYNKLEIHSLPLFDTYKLAITRQYIYLVKYDCLHFLRVILRSGWILPYGLLHYEKLPSYNRYRWGQMAGPSCTLCLSVHVQARVLLYHRIPWPPGFFGTFHWAVSLIHDWLQKHWLIYLLLGQSMEDIVRPYIMAVTFGSNILTLSCSRPRLVDNLSLQ